VDDEAAALEYARKRDPQLFRLLVERYHVRVFRLVASLLGPYADREAQDVTQEVFLRASEKMVSFRGESRFGTWLFRLAYNRTIEHRRAARIRLPHVSEQALQKLAIDPLGEQVQLERQQVVGRLLEQLPDVYRTVINMHYWLDCSVEEIAEALGVPTGTVKSYLSRARERLREHARDAGIELGDSP
jgi:RNA polymerase sigma-70 factor (ECF subfamily)